MGKKKIIIICVVCAAFLLAVFIFDAFVTGPRTLRENTGTDGRIYVPRGLADVFTDDLAFSPDDDRMWIYKLNEKEVNAVEQDLKNGIWKKATKQNYEDIKGQYINFGGRKREVDGLTDDYKNWYICLYDKHDKNFIDLKSEEIYICHSELFIYDIQSKTYVCFFWSM